MTQAAGMYNTLLAADDPAIVVEVLNGYRTKERCRRTSATSACRSACPRSCAQGSDVTRRHLRRLLPHRARGGRAPRAGRRRGRDRSTSRPCCRSTARRRSSQSLQEDQPPARRRRGRAGRRIGLHPAADRRARRAASTGSTPAPRTLAGQEHRPAYGSDGDYWSKPNRETIFDAVYDLLNASDPRRYRQFT